MPAIQDIKETYHDGDDRLIIKKNQVIGDDFFTYVDAVRDASKIGEWWRPVAVIPTLIIEEWAREGFDWQANAKETLKRLSDRDMQKLIVGKA